MISLSQLEEIVADQKLVFESKGLGILRNVNMTGLLKILPNKYSIFRVRL